MAGSVVAPAIRASGSVRRRLDAPCRRNRSRAASMPVVVSPSAIMRLASATASSNRMSISAARPDPDHGARLRRRVAQPAPPKPPVRWSGSRSTASHHPSKAASSDAPRHHHSVHYQWWTLSASIRQRQSGKTGRLRVGSRRFVSALKRVLRGAGGNPGLEQSEEGTAGSNQRPLIEREPQHRPVALTPPQRQPLRR